MTDKKPDRPDGDGLLRLAKRCRGQADNIGHNDRSINPVGLLLDVAAALEKIATSPTRDGAEGAGDPCPYCKKEMHGADDCENCGCGSPARATKVAPPKPAPSLDTISVADSTGEKPGTHGASKEAGGHSRGGLNPVSTLSEKPAPDAMQEAFIAGADAVHREWVRCHADGEGPPRGDPDFTETANDYALSAPVLPADAPIGEDTPYWRTLRAALVLPVEEQYAIAKDLAANCGYELTGDAYTTPSPADTPSDRQIRTLLKFVSSQPQQVIDPEVRDQICDLIMARPVQPGAGEREALQPFATFGFDEGGNNIRDGLMRDRICDWFGPSDFDAARVAYSRQAPHSSREGGR